MSNNVIVYGSLLDRKELQNVFSVDNSKLFRVIVKNYQRSFNQNSTWRSGPNGERGVLTSFPKEGSYINAVLITGISEDEYISYCDREKGYHIVSVDCENILSYSDEYSINESAEMAVGGLWVDEVVPIPEYKQLCFTAAKEWGDEFYNDFVDTTYDSVEKPDVTIDLDAGFKEESDLKYTY